MRRYSYATQLDWAGKEPPASNHFRRCAMKRTTLYAAFLAALAVAIVIALAMAPPVASLSEGGMWSIDLASGRVTKDSPLLSGAAAAGVKVLPAATPAAAKHCPRVPSTTEVPPPSKTNRTSSPFVMGNRLDKEGKLKAK